MDFSGPDFTLGEDGQKDEHLVIDAIQNGKTHAWRVRTGYPAITASAASLPEALHRLANELDARNSYTAAADVEAIKLRNRLRLCQYCEAPIFFAKTQNDKWMPIDAEQIHVGPGESMRCFNVFDKSGSLQARPLTYGQGDAWVAHPDVCGIVDDEPLTLALVERWKTNRAKVLLDRDKTVEDLQRIAHDLNDGGLGGTLQDR